MRQDAASLCLMSLAVAAICATAALGQSPGGVLFYASFDGEASLKTGYVASADADVAAADRAATLVSGVLKFEPGKRGNALLLGEGAAQVAYNLEKNILPQQGTLEFWLCAKDWEFSDGRYHVFLEADGPDGSVILYFKTPTQYYCNWWIGTKGTDAQGRNRFDVMDPSVGFAPGRWGHFVFTWSKEEAAFYTDTERQKWTANPKLPAVLTRLILEDRPLEGSHNAHTLIDEFYIYDRALNEREVAWLFEHAEDREKGKGLPLTIGSPEATLTPVPCDNVIRVAVDTGARMQGVTGVATLEPAAGSEPAALRGTDSQKVEGVVHYDRLPPGEYVARVVLKDAKGAESGTCEKSLVVPDASQWLDNSIGISDTPPFPWTPLQSTRNETGTYDVACWGRTYRLGTLGLPAEIKTCGQEILAAPVTLVAQAAGRDVAWQETPVELNQHNDVEAILTGSATAEAGELTWKCAAEFDGMLRYDLECRPKEGVAFDKLELRFPLKTRNARLMWTREQRGLMPEGQGVLVQRPWNPYIWVGDEDRGLVVFCESEGAWQEVDAKPGFLLERNGNTVEVVWRFANAGTPWRLDKPWKLTFGIEATPVKDATYWRRFRPAGLAATPPGYHNVWINHDGAQPPGVRHMKYFGYPEPSVSVEKYRAAVAAMKNGGPHDSGPCLVLQYLLAECLSGHAPEAFYGAEWRTSPYPSGEWAHEGSLYGPMLTIAPIPAWRDFITWKMSRFMSEMGTKGVYSDFSMIMVADNPLTGFPLDVRDGKARQFWPFFATRELYKRIYTMHRQHGDDTFFFGHVANQMYVPFAAFLDGALDGEHLNADPDNDYPELLPLDLIQVQYAGKNLGVCTYFLPLKVPIEQRKNWDTASKPYMVGMALLHDYGVYWGSFDMKPIDALMYEFDVADAEFIPYWRNADLVGGQNDAVKCSVYRKKGDALMAVASVSRQPQTAELSVDWEQLKGPGDFSLTDPLEHKPLSAEGAKLTVSLPPFGYQLIRIKERSRPVSAE